MVANGKMLSIAQAFGPATGPVVVKTWFQRRYAAIIREDKQRGKPRLANQWPNALKFDKRVKHLCHSNTAAAEKFSNGLHSLNKVSCHWALFVYST